jgi:PadR family transcriptional regulator, regulatory protein PadR
VLCSHAAPRRTGRMRCRAAAQNFFRKLSLAYIAPQCITGNMKLEKELVAASSVPLVLSILSGGDSYGYAIIQRVKELSAGEIEWTDGMLYPVLHWLEEQRLVRSRWVKSESGRKRKYYSLQSEGREALREQKQQWILVTATFNQLWNPQHA